MIKDNSGRAVWDLTRYTGFIKDGAAAPDTVNPSLWRISQLLMDAGLYEVVPGVYQVRGADLSNLTIVEGEQGITIYDPLISAETARAALDLYYQEPAEEARRGRGLFALPCRSCRGASAALWTKRT